MSKFREEVLHWCITLLEQEGYIVFSEEDAVKITYNDIKKISQDCGEEVVRRLRQETTK